MSKKINTGILLSILSVSLLPLYQNCANTVDFAKEANFALTQGEAEIVDFSINPQSWENRPKINITAVVDNSHSMAEIQEKVAVSLEQSLMPLQNFSGKISLYSTTQETNLGEESYPSVVALPYVETNDTYLNLQRKGYKAYSLPTSYTYASDNTREELHYRPENLREVAGNFGDSVVQLGIKGSSNEQGICTLLRSMDDAKQDQGALNVFLLVSDQNDGTDLSKCIKKSHNVVRMKGINPEVFCNELSEEAALTRPECTFHGRLSYKKEFDSKTSISVQVSNPDSVTLQAIQKDYSRRKVIAKYNVPAKYKINYDYTVPTETPKIRIETLNKAYSTKDAGVYKTDLEYSKTYNYQNKSCIGQGFEAQVLGKYVRACNQNEKNHFLNLNARDDEGNPVTMLEECQATCTDLEPDTGSYTVNAQVLPPTVGSCPTGQAYQQVKQDFCAEKDDDNCDIKCTEISGYEETVSKRTGYQFNACDDTSLSSNSFGDLASYMDKANFDQGTKNKYAAINANNFVSTSYSCDKYEYYKKGNSAGWSVEDQTTPISSLNCTDAQISEMKSKLDNYKKDRPFTCYAKSSPSNPSTLNQNLELVWDNNSDCSSSEIDNIAEANNIDASRVLSCIRKEKPIADDTKNLELSYSMAKVCNVTSNSSLAPLIQNFEEGLDEGYQYQGCLDTGRTGSYTYADSEEEDQTIHEAYVEFGDADPVSAIAKHLDDNLKFQLATFTTPNKNDPEYSKCPVPYVEGLENPPVPFDEGKIYTDLVSEVQKIAEGQGSSYNICDDDYSPALSNVVDKVVKQAEFTYQISLAPYESVYKVFVVDNFGVESQVGPTDYEIINSSLIKLSKEVMGDGENVSSIRVQIWRDLIAKKEYDLRGPASTEGIQENIRGRRGNGSRK